MEILLSIIIGILALQVLYYFVFSIGGVLYSDKKLIKSDYKRRIAVFIPAYKEDKVILSTVKNIQKQQYRSNGENKYEIIVVAQHLKPYTLKALKKLHCTYITYNVKNSTKNKSLIHAQKTLDKQNKKFDIALILDADNHISDNFLEKLNSMFAYEHEAIQCHRLAKNLNTSVAVFDAVSEEISNSITRKGCNYYGLSASIVGSGMALEYNLFRRIINKLTAIAGCDKELTCELASDNIVISYLESALVYDEKTQELDIFKMQRTRWYDAQISIAKEFAASSFKSLIKKGNINFFIKTLEQLILPKLMLLLTLGLFTIITIILSVIFDYKYVALFSALTFLLYIITLVIAIPKYLMNKKLISAIIYLPKIIVASFKSILNIRQSQEKFIHTPHTLN